MPALLSRAFNAALGKRQSRKKHHGICLLLSLSLSVSFSVLPNGRASRRSADESWDRGRGSSHAPIPSLCSRRAALLLSLFFAGIHVLLEPLASAENPPWSTPVRAREPAINSSRDYGLRTVGPLRYRPTRRRDLISKYPRRQVALSFLRRKEETRGAVELRVSGSRNELGSRKRLCTRAVQGNESNFAKGESTHSERYSRNLSAAGDRLNARERCKDDFLRQGRE